MRDTSRLPGWPPVLDLHLAAPYLRMSATTFLSAVAPNVPKVQLTTRLVGWMRTDLDDWLAHRPRDGASSPPVNPWDQD